MKRTIVFYKTAMNKCPVEDFLDSLPEKVLHKTLAIFKLVENQDFVSVRFFKRLKDTNLWEIRIQYGSSIYRYLCFQVQNAVIVLTHGFVKKTKKTPSKEIDKAEAYRKDHLRRHYE